jgi:hypothetical protein
MEEVVVISRLSQGSPKKLHLDDFGSALFVEGGFDRFFRETE